MLPISPTEAKFLQRLVADAPPRRQMSKSALWFVDHHGIGTAYARHVEYLSRHLEKAREILNLFDIPVESLAMGASRSDAAKSTGQSEKTQSRAPWSNAVAIKMATPLGNLWGLPGAFMVTTIAQALQVRCDRLLVVENLETFREIEKYLWLKLSERAQTQTIMVVYRGDSTASNGDCMDMLRQRIEPVMAFTDFDPGGLGIALNMPRLEKLFLPDEAWLRKSARGPRSLELYERSRQQYETKLNASQNLVIQPAWLLLKSLCAGVSQEAMRDADGSLL